MALDVGVRAKLEPQLDDKAVDQETQELEERFTEAEQMQPQIDGGQVEDQLQEFDMGGLGMPEGGGIPGGGAAAGAAGAGAGGGILSKVMKGGLLKVTLGGAVGFGILAGINRMAAASPAWTKTQQMFGEAMNLFFRPFGNKLATWFGPLAGDILDMAVQFNDIASSDGLATAIIDIPGNILSNLSPEGAGTGIGSLLGGGLGLYGGAKLGAAAGATLGSIIPGAGTAVGGAAGGIIGGGLGLASGALAGGGLGNVIGEKIGEVNWPDWLNPLEWDSFLDVLKWTSLINPLTWPVWINKLAWDEWVGDVDWESYVPDLSWNDFAAALSWTAFLNPLSWGSWLNVLAWSGYLDNLQWTDWLTEVSWTDWLNPLNWGDWIDGLDFSLGGNRTAQGGIVTSAQTRTVGEAGPEAILPLSDLQRALENAARAGGGGGRGAAANRDDNAMSEAVGVLRDVRRELSRLDPDVTLEMDNREVAKANRKANERYETSRITTK